MTYLFKYGKMKYIKPRLRLKRTSSYVKNQTPTIKSNKMIPMNKNKH